MDTGRACPAVEYHAQWREQGLSMPSPACLVDLAKLFSISTDYLLGVERLDAVNVTGLNEEDIALLAQLADRLRETH